MKAMSVFRSYWFLYHIAVTHIKLTPYTSSQGGQHLFQRTKYTYRNEIALVPRLCREARWLGKKRRISRLRHKSNTRQQITKSAEMLLPKALSGNVWRCCLQKNVGFLEMWICKTGLKRHHHWGFSSWCMMLEWQKNVRREIGTLSNLRARRINTESVGATMRESTHSVGATAAVHSGNSVTKAGC